MTDHHLPGDVPGDQVDPVDLGAVGADDRLLDEIGAGRHRAPSAPTDASATDLFATDLFRAGPHPVATVVDAPSDGRGRHAAPEGADADPLARLLVRWRESLRPDDLPAPPAAPAHRAVRRRRVTPMVAAAASIVALLFGTAAVGARTAGPDDVLWPLTRMLWPDRIESVEAKEHAVVALQLARTALQEGITPQASVVLTSAASDISKVHQRDGRAELDRDYQELWNRLQELDDPTDVATSPTGPSAASTTSSASTQSSPTSSRPDDTGPRASSSPTGPGGSREPSAVPPVTTPAGPSTSQVPSSAVTSTTPPVESTESPTPSQSVGETTGTPPAPGTSTTPTTVADDTPGDGHGGATVPQTGQDLSGD